MLNTNRQDESTRYFEKDFATYAVKILPGQYFVTTDATAITTLLGSCISVCLYDKEKGIGGMNHFMLPTIQSKANVSQCTSPYGPPCANPCSDRYGKCALKHLLEQLETAGANRENLKAKIFGGGRIMAGVADIGEKNSTFAFDFLEQQHIPVVASDFGDNCPRKIVFFPATGRVFVKRLPNEPRGSI